MSPGLIRGCFAACIVASALVLAACAPAGYVYETGNFVRPHPTQALCASRGQALDMSVEECVTPAPPPPPTPEQAAQSQRANAVTSERNACVADASAKFERANRQGASYQIWLAELKACENLMISRLTAQKLVQVGGNCSAKLDWMHRYRSMVYDVDQQAMAEQRYAENCAGRR